MLKLQQEWRTHQKQLSILKNIQQMETIKVNSSSLSELGYDAESKVMYAKFNSG